MIICCHISRVLAKHSLSRIILPQYFYVRENSSRSRKRSEFQVDTAGLGKTTRSTEESNANNLTKESQTPLAVDLKSFIQFKGPITMCDFMAQTSNNLIHGYYQHTVDKIGKEGDFITAPEISQLFGEMMSMWLVSTWSSLGCPNEIDIVELGPGKGTLMMDILRVTRKFSKFHSAIRVHMVEISDTMRQLQHNALLNGQDPDPPPNELETSKEKQDKSNSNSNKITSLLTPDGVQVSWHSALRNIPSTVNTITNAPRPCLIIGQEFLDAFPVHQFIFKNGGWKEKLVDVDGSSDSPHHFRIVLSPSVTPAIKTLLLRDSKPLINSPVGHTRLDLPSYDELSALNKNKKSNDSHAHGTLGTSHTASPQEGDGIEICPLALATCEDVAVRLKQCNGAALFVDYGEDCTQADTLRAFHKHALVPILSQPGWADLTADVDFAACARAAVAKCPTVRATPLFTQAQFLAQMGIVARAEQLLNNPKITEQQAIDLMFGFKKLMSEEEMGKKFKVLELTHGLSAQ